MILIKDRLVLERLKAPKKTKSGLIMESGGVEPPNIGIVRFKGPEVKDIQVGNLVAVGTKWFSEFKLGSKTFVVLNEPDLIGIIDKEDLALLSQVYELSEFSVELSGVLDG